MENSESRERLQEAEGLVQKVVSLANPSRPANVQNAKLQQAQQLKSAVINKDAYELEKCIRAMEETTEKAKKRLEEMEPKSIQLVSLVKYIKEALSRESMGMANNIKFEEERLAQAQKELAEVVEHIAEEKREIESRIENAKNQVTQMELKMRAIPEASQTSNLTPEEEEVLAHEEKRVKVLEDKLGRLIEISDQNNEEFNEKHNVILEEIEYVQKMLNDTISQNQAKQNMLTQENQRTADLEKTMREMEKKLAALRES